MQITYKLLVQAKLLKDEGNKTWEETDKFVSKLTGASTANRLRYLIESASTTFLELQTPEEAAGFLEKLVDIESLGDFCAKAGLTWQTLIKGSFEYMDSSPNNGLPIELEHFRKKQQLPFHQMHSWFTRMTGTDIAQPKLKKMLDKTMTAFRKMQTNSGKPGGATALSSFRMTPFVSSLPASHSPALPIPASSPSDQHCLGSGFHPLSSTVPDYSSSPLSAAEANLKLAHKGSELAAARQHNEDLERKISALHDKSAVINFMERCCIKDDAYKWPQVQDQAVMESKFVIMSDFEMSSRNGRIWTLDDAHSVRARFNAYKQYFL